MQQFMGSQIVRHDLVTEQKYDSTHIYLYVHTHT